MKNLFKMVWNSIFNNDAHKIVSEAGEEKLNWSVNDLDEEQLEAFMMWMREKEYTYYSRFDLWGVKGTLERTSLHEVFKKYQRENLVKLMNHDHEN